MSEKFVHSPKALGHIYLALKKFDETIHLVHQAIFKKGRTSLVKDKIKPWQLFAKKAALITEEALKKYGYPGEVCRFKNQDGFFLSSKMIWKRDGADAYFFHWHSERYVEEALALLNETAYKTENFYLRENGTLNETKCDSLNWIDDKEEFDIG